jgi:hypothetical protein
MFKDKAHFIEVLTKSIQKDIAAAKDLLSKNDNSEEPHKDLHKHISMIEHRNEGGVNSMWTIHTKGGKSHSATSIDGESPSWDHNDEKVHKTHPEVAKILDKTVDHPHSKQCDSSACHTIHDATGKKVLDKSHEMV